MCTKHPTRQYCSTCGKQYGTAFDRVKPCFEFRLKSACSAGVTDKTSWAEDYTGQCDKCVDRERKREEQGETMGQEKDGGSKKQASDGGGSARMETIPEGDE